MEYPSVRTIGAAELRKWFGRQKGQCTWCGGPVPKGRVKWCSKTCVDQYAERYWPQHIRNAVERRDKGVCSNCGHDCRHWAMMARRFNWRNPDPTTPCVRWEGGRQKINRRSCRNLRRYLLLSRPKNRKRLRDASCWEADHIVPVIEGGAALGLENIRTLCLACHKKETAALAARRARKRTKSKSRHPLLAGLEET